MRNIFFPHYLSGEPFIFAYGVLPFGAQIGLGFGLNFVLY